MWGLIVSGLGTLLGFAFRSVIAKFFAFFVLYFVVVGFIGVLQASGLLPTTAALGNAFSNVSPSVWYFLDLAAINVGLPMILSAHAARFIIRRIPLLN